MPLKIFVIIIIIIIIIIIKLSLQNVVDDLQYLIVSQRIPVKREMTA